MPVRLTVRAGSATMKRSLEEWIEWHRRLETALDLPCPGFITNGETEMFVLVHQVYGPSEVEPTPAGLICDVRQENRPMLLPLAEVDVDPDHPGASLLGEYRGWLAMTD